MIIHNVKQGSPEWFACRAGVISASNFWLARQRVGGLTDQQKVYVDFILNARLGAMNSPNPVEALAGVEKAAMAAAGYKAKPSSTTVERALRGEMVGDFSDGAKNYAFRLAIERISGEPLDEGFQLWQAKRGQELEPEARAAHERMLNIMVEEVGFVTTDDRAFGASADGFIDLDGGSEYKAFLAPEKLRDIIIDGNTTEVIDQVQGGMWLTGRKWWHLGLYCPALKAAGKDLTVIEIKRDDDYIEKMEIELLAFKALVDGYEKKLRSSPTPGALLPLAA